MLAHPVAFGVRTEPSNTMTTNINLRNGGNELNYNQLFGLIHKVCKFRMRGVSMTRLVLPRSASCRRTRIRRPDAVVKFR